MLAKNDWQEWQNHVVTRKLKEAITERINEGISAILGSNDPDADRVTKGIIIGLNDILEWEPELIEEHSIQ